MCRQTGGAGRECACRWTPPPFFFTHPSTQKAAQVVKDALDKKYGLTWQVIVGEGFGYNGERGEGGGEWAGEPRPLSTPNRLTVTHHKDHMHFCFYGEKLGILVYKC